jgi:hypothetical protein
LTIRNHLPYVCAFFMVWYSCKSQVAE